MINIFTASTGRTGTGYLARLFNTLSNCTAGHETTFIVQGEPYKGSCVRGDDRLLNSEIDKGLYRLAAVKTAFHLDSSHMFIKGYAKYILDKLDSAIVLDIRRNPLDVATSLANKNTFIGSNLGDSYLYNPYSSSNEIILNKLLIDELTPFQKLLLYCFEVYARSNRCKDIYSDKIVAYNIEFADLFNKDFMFRLFDLIGLEPTKHTDTIFDNVVNSNRRKTISRFSDIKEFLELFTLIRREAVFDVNYFDYNNLFSFQKGGF